MLCGCRDYHNDEKCDSPDTTYMSKSYNKVEEKKELQVAWTEYRGRSLDIDYLPIQSVTSPYNINLKYISSIQRDSTYESWYILQQVDGHRIKYYDELVFRFIDVYGRVFDEESIYNTCKLYWLTSNPDKPDTAVVKLQSNSRFNPTNISLYLTNTEDAQFSYVTRVTNCDIETNLGYKALWQPLSLVQLNDYYYIVSSSLANDKVSDDSVSISNIVVIPVNGSFEDFTNNIQDRIVVGSGNKFAYDNNTVYEYTDKIRLPNFMKIKVTTRTDAYPWEGPMPFYMSMKLYSKDRNLASALKSAELPAIYLIKDDNKDLIPIYAYCED